jgi:hypothetical protein
VTCTGAAADQLCQALHAGTSVSLTCGGRSWAVGACGGIEINANGPVCTCDGPGYTVRPCVQTANWGGAGTATCNAPTQTITVVCN